jgi:2-polyprenyl-3-methyl-5-hydroxy-6-metoxy-1,4-benzoquinol methylase
MISKRLLQRLRPLICPLEPLLAQMPPLARVLDIGCGTGALLLRAVAEGRVREGLGTDVSRPALQTAQQTWQEIAGQFPGTRLSFQQAESPESLPGPWEVVVMVDVIHHVPPSVQEAFLRAAFRLVAPGGRMIYKDMCIRPWWKRAMNRLHDLVMARQWIHEVPLEKVRQWAAEESLEIITETHYSRLWYGHELLVLHRPGPA